MIYKSLLLALIIIIIPFETSLISLPVFFVLATLTYVLYPQVAVLAVISLASVVLDALRLSPIGSTFLFLLFIFLLIEMVRDDVIFSDYKIITLFLFVCSYVYARFFNYTDNLWVYALVFLSSFAVISYFSKKGSWLK